MTADLYQPIDNLFVDAELRLPGSNADGNYGKVYFRTHVDVKKVLSEVRENYLVSVFFDAMLKSIDFEPKLPTEKVIFMFGYMI